MFFILFLCTGFHLVLNIVVVFMFFILLLCTGFYNVLNIVVVNVILHIVSLFTDFQTVLNIVVVFDNDNNVVNDDDNVIDNCR